MLSYNLGANNSVNIYVGINVKKTALLVPVVTISIAIAKPYIVSAGAKAIELIGIGKMVQTIKSLLS